MYDGGKFLNLSYMTYSTLYNTVLKISKIFNKRGVCFQLFFFPLWEAFTFFKSFKKKSYLSYACV